MLMVACESIVWLIMHLTWLFEFQFEFNEKVDFLQLQCNPRTDLTPLKKHLDHRFRQGKTKLSVNLSPTNTIKFPIG